MSLKTTDYIEGRDNWRINLYPAGYNPNTEEPLELHDDFVQELDEAAVALAEAALVANPTAEVIAHSDGGMAVYLVDERRFDDGELEFWTHEAPT